VQAIIKSMRIFAILLFCVSAQASEWRLTDGSVIVQNGNTFTRYRLYRVGTLENWSWNDMGLDKVGEFDSLEKAER